MAFTLISEGSALPAPALAGGTSNDAAGFASCYGPHRRSPLQGFRHWAPTRPVSRPSRQPATGPPGSYPDRTSTGRRRRAYEQQDPPWHYVTVSPPVLLGARNAEARDRVSMLAPLEPAQKRPAVRRHRRVRAAKTGKRHRGPPHAPDRLCRPADYAEPGARARSPGVSGRKCRHSPGRSALPCAALPSTTGEAAGGFRAPPARFASVRWHHRPQCSPATTPARERPAAVKAPRATLIQ